MYKEIEVKVFLENPYAFKACSRCRAINSKSNIKCVLCDSDFFDIVREEDIQRLKEYSKIAGKEANITVVEDGEHEQ